MQEKRKLIASIFWPLLTLLFSILWLSPAESAEAGADRATYTYGPASDGQYSLDVFGSNPSDSATARPAIVFFHGGAWVQGDKSVFDRHAEILSQRTGLRVISVNYPLHGNPIESTTAAQAAVCWVRTHADALGIDPKRIALSGHSAGGQLAVAVALINSKLAPECANVAPPYATLLILFSPVLDLTGVWEKRAGMPLSSVSPMQLLNQHVLPPTLIMQGTADQVTPIDVARKFVDAARSKGAKDVELIPFDGRPHGFFINKMSGDLDSTVNDSVDFLNRENWPIAKRP